MSRFAALRLVGATLALTFGGASAAQARDARPRYVSMGSSYAAGPGVGVRDPASGACGRSMSNYARQVAARRGYELIDVACSGATTANILSQPQAGFPAQIEAVTADTRLVTVTIGGNDVAYVANLMGYSCRDAGGACAVTSDAAVEAGFQTLPGALRRLVGEVHRRAPKAELVLVGYLPVLPEPGHAACPAADPLSEADETRLRSVAARLDAVMARVAAETKTAFVRSAAIGRGHDICAAEPWMAGYKPATTPGWPLAVAYHPNQAGMTGLAAAIESLVGPPPRQPVFTPAAKGAPFSSAVRVGDILYLAGQIGVDATGKLPDGMPAQATQAMENIRGVLATHGLGFDDVFKCTVMLADMSQWADFNRIYATYFRSDRLPARSAMGANGLANGAKVEVECWARMPDR